MAETEDGYSYVRALTARSAVSRREVVRFVGSESIMQRRARLRLSSCERVHGAAFHVIMGTDDPRRNRAQAAQLLPALDAYQAEVGHAAALRHPHCDNDLERSPNSRYRCFLLGLRSSDLS